jgi:three-Cys-motif partner protein
VPKRRTRYEEAPDGLPARDVGTWAEQKAHYVDRYSGMFATAMRTHFARRFYVELFAGPGMSWDRHRRRFILGSSMRALSSGFTDYAFIDIDPVAASALNERLNRSGIRTEKRAEVYIGDCNDAAPIVAGAMPRNAITLAFIDPTTWQVTFDSIRALAEGRRVDLLFTFHAPTMRRMVTDNPPALTRFFGTPDWPDAVRSPKREVVEALLRLFNDQLETIGYKPGSHELAVPIRNTAGAVIYYLVLFSKNELGLKFWREASKVRPSGELNLGLF